VAIKSQKVKFTPEWVVKVLRGRKDVALLFL
jgi:hypothetical protein